MTTLVELTAVSKTYGGADGRVMVAGEDLGRLSEARLARFRRARLGFVFQFFNLLGNLTVLENVLIPAQLQGTRPGQGPGPGAAGPARHRGARRPPPRPPLGRPAAAGRDRPGPDHQPVLLLADEPTGALDTHGGEQVMKLIQGLNREGQTVLRVTHDAKLAAATPVGS